MIYETHDASGAVALCPNGAPPAKDGFTVREASADDLTAIAEPTGALLFDGSKLVRVVRPILSTL